MVNLSFILLLSSIISIIGAIIIFGIFKKVYQEKYKRPWIFIAISTLFFTGSNLIRFFMDYYGYNFFSRSSSLLIDYIFGFIGMAILVYGLLLEYLILKFYKGKFVKMKLIPIQEGTLGGEIDLNVSKGSSYLAIKKDIKYLQEEFSLATRKGFEGFLLTEQNPREIRVKYALRKTPIAWIKQVDSSQSDSYIAEEFVDESTEIVDPLQLNKIISFIDNFLEQATSPFIMLDINQIVRMNSFQIVAEFLQYISHKSNSFNGIFIVLINEDLLKDFQISQLKEFLNELE
jgi:hypothetical protein